MNRRSFLQMATAVVSGAGVGLNSPWRILSQVGEVPRLPTHIHVEILSLKVSQVIVTEIQFADDPQFRYSSGGFAVLGRIIEVVSGKPYEQFMKERIFDALGMKDSG